MCLIDEISPRVREKSYRLLGVHIDADLSWKEHIKQVAAKVKSFLYGMRRIRFEVDEHVRLSYFKAYIMSTIQFAIEIWGNSTSFNVLEKLQKQGVRMIKAKKFVIHTSPLFKDFKILPLNLLLEQRERCLALIYVFGLLLA